MEKDQKYLKVLVSVSSIFKYLKTLLSTYYELESAPKCLKGQNKG